MKWYVVSLDEKYKELNQSGIYDEEEQEEGDPSSLSSEYPLSFAGRAVLLSSIYDLLLYSDHQHWVKIESPEEEQRPQTVIRHLFPKVLNHQFIFYSTLDYLNELMTS